MILDLGTGDGKAVLRRARREPRTLVIGLDADTAAMREASQRAARQPRKGGLPNVLFLAAAAEQLPGPLAGRVDHLVAVLPWGSLLRGFACAEPGLLAAVGDTLTPAGELEVMLSVKATDRSAGLPILGRAEVDALLAAYRAVGLTPIEARSATAADVDRLGSSWARRLAIPARRAAWLLRFRRATSRR